MCTENYHWHHDYVRLAWDSGFCFDAHKSKSNFDWSSIGLVDVDRVSRDRDIAAVEKHIATILCFSLDDDQTKILDPTFVKVFRLSQLSLQYLQFCKRYLDNTVVLLKKQIAKQNEENVHSKEHSEELRFEISDLKKKIKELKLSLQCQPMIADTGGNLKCSECSKVFLNEEFLEAHMKRRHAAKDANPLQKETDKLQLEIKELKERLNSTEKYVQGDHNLSSVRNKPLPLPNNDLAEDVRVSVLQDKFEHLKDHVEKELNVLRDEKQYQEKYEKWFELVFQRLDHSKKELLDDDREVKENFMGDGVKRNTKENSTQTILEVDVDGSGVNSGDNVAQVKTSEIQTENEKPDLKLVQKIQEDIRVNTETHLDQIQDVLQQKLTGGLEQIQTQMNSFWQKINDLELQKNQQAQISKPLTGELEQIQTQMNSFWQKMNDLELQKSQPAQISKPGTDVTSTPDTVGNIETPVKPKPAPRIAKNVNLIQTKPKIIDTRPNVSKQTLQTYYVTHVSKDEHSNDEDRSTPIIVHTPVKKLYREEGNILQSEDDEVALERVQATKPGRNRSMYPRKTVGRTVIKRAVKGSMKIKQLPVTDSESSHTELQSVAIKPQIKPSNTSTLAQRSLTSLKQAVNYQEVRLGLKEELQDVVGLRLKEIGVSPHWTGLPRCSYSRALKIVNHRASLFAKKYPNYLSIRQQILQNLEAQVQNRSKRKFTVKIHEKTKPTVHFSRKVHQRTKTKTIADDAYIADIDNSDQVGNRAKNQKKIIDNKETDDDSSNSSDTNADQTFKIPNETATKQNYKITKLLKVETPVKKKVLFDVETSSSNSVQNTEKPVSVTAPQTNLHEKESSDVEAKNKLNVHRGTKRAVSDLEKEHDTGKFSSPEKPKQDINFLVSKPRTAFKVQDEESTTSVASSVLDGSKTRIAVAGAEAAAKLKSAKEDDISDWEISDLLT